MNHHRLEYIQFEITLATSDGYGCMVAHNLAAYHRHSLGLSGIDLSWHNTGSWFIGRQGQFTDSASGARTEPSDVVCNLH